LKRNILIYLKDILKNIEYAENFTKDYSFSDFCKDEKTQYAVIRSIEIIGEAAKNVPNEIRDKYNTIPFKEMSGMRDKLIHFYFGVNLNLIWKAITEEFPAFKITLSDLINEMTIQGKIDF
jgi:uncharacterized protein with HEPN domain